MSTAGLLAVEAGLLLALVTALWAVSVAVRDSSIVDVFWGSGFVAVAWVGFALADGSRDRRLLLAALVTVWGLRLTAYLARRNLGKGEDRRYAAMRRRHGDRWPLRSLVIVFWLQGALIWVVSLPVQVAMIDPTPPGLGALDWAGAALWAVGLAFEAVGDLQLARFKADPANRGKVMDRGLWRYTRHPNYFGDFCVWWGIWLVALATGSAWWTAVGPAVMSVLLIRVSGAALLERSLSRRREGYADYVARTSAFFPWPPIPARRQEPLTRRGRGSKLLSTIRCRPAAGDRRGKEIGMSYHLAGRSTEFCSCNAPCPCAFGQEATGGTCDGIFCFDIQEGELDGVSLAGAKAALLSKFHGAWTGGNFTAALVLDENASEEQRDALEKIYTGQLGGDAAGLAQLIGDMKGVFTAPFEYSAGGGEISFTAGEVAAGAGSTLKSADGSAEIRVIDANYPLPEVTAGRATRVMVKVPGLEYEHDGSGFWTGSFELNG